MKSTIVRAVLAVAFFSCFWAGCEKDNPAAPPADAAYIGTWTGLTLKTGGILPDSFSVVLTITKTNYTLIRSILTHASSGSAILDSAWETGTCAASGNNVVLTGTVCKVRAGWQTALEATGCSAPKTLAVAIADNKWKVTINEWKNDEPVNYEMQKQ